MRNYWIIAWTALLGICTGQAQTTFTFEDGVPEGWTVTEGTLATTGKTYKEGTQALAWDTEKNAQMDIPVSFKALTTNGTLFYLHSPQVTNDTLTIEFKSSGQVKRQANVLCNFKGWREFNRTYAEYATKTAVRIDNVTITWKLNPNVPGTRQLLFDNWTFENTTNLDAKVDGPHMKLDRNYLKGNMTCLKKHLFERDIPLEQPTTAELEGLRLVRERTARNLPVPTTVQVRVAMNFFNAMNISEDEDGNVSGTPIDITCNGLTDTYIQTIFTHLRVLAKVETQQELFSKAVRFILDQGIGEGCNYILSSTIDFYTSRKEIPSLVLDVASVCQGDIRQQLLDFVQYVCFYNEVYQPEDSYLANLVSDYVYLDVPHFEPLAALQPDDTKAVRELKAVKRYLDRCTEYTPGARGILKPDGTGFHHNAHYNNYMYSYMTWTQAMWQLKGTPFRLQTDSYKRFKKAVLSLYIMATKHSTDACHYYANSFAGRNPFGAGISLAYSKALFESLIEVGEDIAGEEDELKAAYNYFFGSDAYQVPTTNYDGFYAFNYSPAAIFRKANWVVSMKSLTTNSWGAEIYNGQNRFGRYQSHGSLDVLYDGPLSVSGYPTNLGAGGWDWNVVPGTTTVHFTNWKEMMPAGNTTQRFDQYAATKTFTGALADGDCGIFATDFDQTDTWGNTLCFTPTNLRFRKTMFACDNYVWCMTDSISAVGEYSDDRHTATNLFQNIISAESGPLIVDGVEQTAAKEVLNNDVSHWIITPNSTGYFIPKGNDPLHLHYGAQTAPGQTGVDAEKPTTSLLAAKAYFDHGIKPTKGEASFLLMPAATKEKMADAALQCEQGKLFRVEQQDENLHAITYLPGHITAYAFYQPTENLDFGIVQSTTFRHLLLVRHDADNGHCHLAICNPDLCPEKDSAFKWHTTPSHTSLTLRGNWVLAQPVKGVSLAKESDEETRLDIDMAEGMPTYIELCDAQTAKSERTSNAHSLIRLEGHPGGVKLLFPFPTASISEVTINTVDGQKVGHYVFPSGTSEGFVPLKQHPAGVRLIHVSHDGAHQTFKWIHP
ncbi:MAG: chondroitinase family polysaccharide lyase [Bacteroidaceae bacterium]